MSSQILHRLRVHIGINQIGDVGTAQLVSLDLKIHAVDDCIVMGGALTQNRGDGALQLLSVFKITGIGARLGGANRDVLPQACKLRVGQRASVDAAGENILGGRFQLDFFQALDELRRYGDIPACSLCL